MTATTAITTQGSPCHRAASDLAAYGLSGFFVAELDAALRGRGARHDAGIVGFGYRPCAGSRSA